MIETAIQPKSEPAGGHDDICEAVGRSFDRAFARMGTNPKSVTTTFEAALEGLRKAKNPELRLRSIAKSAALSTGRCHGNVVETGRVMLTTLTKEFFVPRFQERDEGEREPPSEQYPWDGVSGVRPFSRLASATTVGVY